MSLPPMPKNFLAVAPKGSMLYDSIAEQAKAYGQQCRAAALEDAARCAESAFKYAKDGYQIADEIRSLK